jgi:transcription antitermination factor NusG
VSGKVISHEPVSEVAKLYPASLKETMATTQIDVRSNEQLVNSASLAEEFDRPEWYAVYTNARHEKRVTEYLGGRMVECYLPLYKSVRRWQDRRKEVDLPLFPGYVFVKIAYRARLQVLTAPGVVQIVSFDGKPSPIREAEIEALRQGLPRTTSFEPHPYLVAGKRVRVRSGPLSGMEGILIRRKEGFRLVVSIELIMRSVAAEVDEADVEAMD